MSDVTLRYPINALVSFHYYSRKDIAEMRDWGLRLIGDSGAFSAANLGAPINIDEFLRWGLKWRDALAWIASLDVIGDAEATWKNYRHLRDRGLDAVPTIHYGCNPAELDRYAADGVDFIGLGGMVGRKSELSRLLRWCLSVFRYARDHHPHMRFHGWGVTHRELIFNLPWYSVDSSGFGSSYRFGRMALFNPRTGRDVNVQLNGRDIFKHADLLRTVYNVNPTDIAVSTPATRRMVQRVSVKAVQLEEDFIRRRHGIVTAPGYGLHKHLGFDGPHIHVADSNAGTFQSLTSGPHIHIANTDTHVYPNITDRENRMENRA